MGITFHDLPAFSDHALVDGAFDPLHAGHIAYLTAAKQIAGAPLLCAVASDDQIRAKGREPLLPQAHRVAVMDALDLVDVVYAKTGPTERVIATMRPRAYLKGEDWDGRLPPAQVSICERLGIPIRFVPSLADSSTARLRAWARAEDAKHLDAFERVVQSQQPASTPWQPVTDYSFEARKAIEGKHPELIKDVFQPKAVLDYGCGPGHLAALLRTIGVSIEGYEPTSDSPMWNVNPWPLRCREWDLVICREVLEHCTVKQVRTLVSQLCDLSSKFVYVTTRFATDPASLLSVDTSDDLDPTHITMLNQDLLRTLFVLEGAKRRADLEHAMDWQKKGRCLVYEVTR